MSSPSFYPYFDDDGPLVPIDLGEGLQECLEFPEPSRAVALSADGTPYSSMGGLTYRVNLELRLFGGASTSALERKLRALENHINRGGLVGFSDNAAKTWAAACVHSPRNGTTAFPTTGNAFTSWGSGVVASGDEVVIESASPEFRRDVLEVSSLSGRNLVTSEASRMSFSRHPMARYRRFWPVLFAHPSDGDRAVQVVQDNRYAYSLIATLRYSPDLAYRVITGGTYLAIDQPTPAAGGLRPSTAGNYTNLGMTLGHMVQGVGGGR